MITVKYDKPKKLACQQSIFVSFPYKQKIVDTIRNLSERVWHPKTKEWELDYKALSELKKKLPYEDFNIIGKPMDDSKYGEKLIEKVYELPKGLKTKLYGYQEEDFNELMNFDKYLVLLEAGLGKSLEMISVALKRKELGQVNHCLIVCGVNTIKFNWQEEIATHVGMSSLVLGARKNKHGVWQTKGTKEKLDDLDNISEFFIITNVESLRSKEIKEKIKKYIDKGIIDMMVVDECHKCFDYNTRVLTNKGYIKIGDIVTKKLNVLVASLNEFTNTIEYNSIVNYFENISVEKKLKLKIFRGGAVREIVCTEGHLFLTKNRGWVRAKDLTGEDDIVDYFDTIKVCHECGKVIDLPRDRVRKGIMFCSTTCANRWRSKHYTTTQKQRDIARRNLKNLWKNKTFREKKSLESKNRMLVDNPVYKEGVVEKAKNTRILKGSYSNNFRYGNGKISPHEKKMQDMLPDTFKYNYAICTKEVRNKYPDRHYPNSYKPDFVDVNKKICIEVDGKDHSKKKKRLLDIKKEECLSLLGYKVLRFTHDDIDSVGFSRRLEECLENL